MKRSLVFMTSCLLLISDGSALAQSSLLGSILNAAKQAQQRQQQQQAIPPQQGQSVSQPISQPDGQSLGNRIGQPPGSLPDCTQPANQSTGYCRSQYYGQQAEVAKIARAQKYFQTIKDKWVVEKVSYDENGRRLTGAAVDEAADLLMGEYLGADFFTGEQCSAVAAYYVKYETAAYLQKGVLFKRLGEAVYKLEGSQTARYVNPNPMISPSQEMLVDNPANRQYRRYDMIMCVQRKHTDTNEYNGLVAASMSDDRAKSLKLFPDLKEERDH